MKWGGRPCNRKACNAMLEDGNPLTWVIIGFIAGGIAKLLMPGRDPGGCIITILLGIAGAMLAGFLGRQLGLESTVDGAGFIGAIVGAFLILLVYRIVLSRRRR